MKSLLKASVLAAVLGGCVASAGYHAHVVVPTVSATVVAEPAPVAVVDVAPAPAEPAYDDEDDSAPAIEYVEPPAYVYVNPQVQVIEDYDYPVFFADGLYWRNDGGVWYSSSYHDRGWGRDREAPMYVRGIDRPEHFVHYRADVHARVGQPGYRYVPPAPVHHAAPPPRHIQQPGHVATPRPAGHGPVEHGHPTEVAHPPNHVEPAHPVTPPGHNEPMHGQGHVEPAHPVEKPNPHTEPRTTPEPTRVQAPPAHTAPVHTEPTHTAPPPIKAAPPPPVKAAPPKAAPPASPPPKKKKP